MLLEDAGGKFRTIENLNREDVGGFRAILQ